VIEELRESREKPFVPTADINVVWVLSEPGTVKKNSNDGVYAGASSDRININHGVELVQQITALRINKSVDEITKEDIHDHGPIFFYNGEGSSTANANYSQVNDLTELVATPEFPIPASKVAIDCLEIAHTPAQIESVAHYLKEHDISGKIAVVSIGAHLARVGRYLEHHKEELPEGVEFVNAASTQTHNPVGTTVREIHKVQQYLEKGDLAEESIFDKNKQ
jgi:hypothetical protein